MENKPDVQGIRFCITTVHEPKGFLFGLKSTSDCFVELEIGVADRRLNQLLSEHRRHQLLDILEFDEYKEVIQEMAVEVEYQEVNRTPVGWGDTGTWQAAGSCPPGYP